MGVGTVATDGALGAVAGVVASKAMTPVTSKIYQAQSDQAKQRENEVSYGVAYTVAAKKTAGLLRMELSEEQATKAGMALHYAIGIAAAPMYALLRRKAGLGPVAAGLATGAGQFLLVDEAVNPLLGFTPPPQKYPAVTHVRGLVGHLVMGAALAFSMEVGWALLRRRPGSA